MQVQNQSNMSLFQGTEDECKVFIHTVNKLKYMLNLDDRTDFVIALATKDGSLLDFVDELTITE